MAKYTLPRGYLSASSISTLQTCPKQFEFRYIHGIINPPTAALACGTVTHKTLETYYKDAMTSSTRLTPAQAAELSRDTFADWTLNNENTVTTEEKNEIDKLLPELVETYIDKIGQYITPKATEREVRITLACGVPLLGYIDLVADDDGKDMIVDYKVKNKKMSKGDVANSLQFNYYALMTGIPDFEIHNLVKTPRKPVSRKAPEVDGVTDHASNLRSIRNRFDGSDALHFEILAETAAKLITAGIFMPCAPDSWCCNDQWCGYWKLCRGKAA